MSALSVAQSRFKPIHPRIAFAIVERVSQERSISVDDILSACRARPLVRARNAIMAELYAMGCGCTYIGRLLDRDPSTVHHSLGLDHKRRRRRIPRHCRPVGLGVSP